MNACLILRNAVRISVLFILAYGTPGWADSITASVHNETTGRPSVGDQVVLLLPAHGLEKESETLTDDTGSFTLPVHLPRARYVIRVVHDNVNYDFPWSSGMAPQIKVYDAVSKVSGLSGYAIIIKVESVGANYAVTEMHAILNESAPPRTQAGSGNLKIYLPPKAEIVSAIAAGPRGTAVAVTPIPDKKQPNGYAIDFPLLPGMTRYAIQYRVASSESIVFHPRLSYPTGQFSVIFPQSIKFMALEPDGFHHGKSGFHRIIDRDGVQVQVISQLKSGQMPAFVLSGRGVLPPLQNMAGSAPSTIAAATNAAITHVADLRDTSPTPSGKRIDMAALGIYIIGSFIALGLCIFFVRVNRERRKHETEVSEIGFY